MTRLVDAKNGSNELELGCVLEVHGCLGAREYRWLAKDRFPHLCRRKSKAVGSNEYCGGENVTLESPPGFNGGNCAVSCLKCPNGGYNTEF